MDSRVDGESGLRQRGRRSARVVYARAKARAFHRDAKISSPTLAAQGWGTRFCCWCGGKSNARSFPLASLGVRMTTFFTGSF